ncbi:MAG: glycosyltransferase, partial [Chloroflexota bacterium]
PYLHEEMGLAFRAADLIVARAGASMLGESPLFGVPSILVPYPHAWRYQKINADYLAERGAAIRLNDENLKSDLLPLIKKVMLSKTELSQMKASAQQLYQAGASKRLALEILETGKQKDYGQH